MLVPVLIGIVAAALLFPRFLQHLRQQEAEGRLRRVCKGDATQAARLIEHEIQRRPGLSRAEAAKRALDTLARDNR
jgi:hypothetical protein